MKINQQEILGVSKLKPKDRYFYFIKRVADFEVLFTLKNEIGDFVLSELDENNLFHVWSAKEFAQLCLIETWKKHTIVEISLDEFENEIIDYIKEKSVLIDVFPVENKTGFVVNLEEFIRDLNIELENY